MASKFAKLCQTSLLKNVVSKCCSISGCSKSLRVASFHSTKVLTYAEKFYKLKPILPNKVTHILRAEVRGDFNIHGTKYFQYAVFLQKSKFHDEIGQLWGLRAPISIIVQM